MEKRMILVLGGARSGKSTYAQNLVEAEGKPGLFVATATAGDAEMAARIAAHQASRSALWTTLESPQQVAQAIQKAPGTDWVLLDCITLLVSNILMSFPEPVDERAYQQAVKAEIEALISTYRAYPGSWILISNEVGLGLVPPYALGRYYRDALGWANQRLAQASDQVLLMVAGIPLHVKG